MPPHLAGRESEYADFQRLLQQETILDNLILTGLRGVGKTVLMETFRPRAIASGWVWVGTDLSESASVTEATMATRLITDLAVATSSVSVEQGVDVPTGFSVKTPSTVQVPVTYQILMKLYESTPGLPLDKLKAVLRFAHECLASIGTPKVVFAYDEAQNLADNSAKSEYPLSVLLDAFQSVQREGIPFLLLLTGLPTLFPKLVESRTYSERMFRVLTLGRLSKAESKEAILKPLDVADCPILFDDASVQTLIRESGGYPYFIQFMCREVFDVIIQYAARGEMHPVPVDAIQRKLDADFFAGRWAKVTDRQRQLLFAATSLNRGDDEFTIQELVEASKTVLNKSFTPSHVNQILSSLSDQGLIYKNRFGKYSFAVPLLSEFIKRTTEGAAAQGLF
ncbi:ATP-binding protein [Arthrobacter sp. NPDC058130]|uniref:ATP-binding protein n=1 Tax=Arthrobacter sp. NPDC058130 TaxID=3346353 RepID=UPI0036F01CD9